MRSFARRRQKLVARVLLVLQLFGTRAHALNDSCNHSHIFYGPALGFRAAMRQTYAWATGEKWERPAPRSFGEREVKHHSCDLDCNCRKSGRKLAPVVIIAQTTSTVAVASSRAAPELLARLPSDLSPVQPPHLHSKK